MLIRFSFKNFKSFKDENYLDMEATSLKEHDYNIVKGVKGNYLKVSAIYGANASGKTNILQAFQYMKRKVLVSDDLNENSINDENVYSFMINNKPMSFEVEILTRNGNIYKYGFLILCNEVIDSEWLYIKNKNKFKLIFERNKGVINSNNSKILKNMNIDEKILLLNIYSKIDKDDLDIGSVYNWFLNTNYLDLGDPNFENNIDKKFSLKVLDDNNYKKELIKFIKSIDVGIEDIKVTLNGTDLKNENKIIDVKVIHKDENGHLKELPFYLESNGTRKMIYLFEFLMEAIKYGKTLFIDELDAKLHPLLTKYIINLFHDSEINKGNGQLIYSTHDIVNLNKETFRRNEIWFVEKTKNGESNMYALSDYNLEKESSNKKVRNDATYNKDYLTGKYGAIPALKEFNV